MSWIKGEVTEEGTKVEGEMSKVDIIYFLDAMKQKFPEEFEFIANYEGEDNG